MKIYTRSGDDGSTGLFGGGRTQKDDPRVEAYGTVDELNASLGVARAAAGDGEVEAALAHLQEALFALGADLATPTSSQATVHRFTEADVEDLERRIDAAEQGLPPLRAFILPAGSERSARLHYARTICRRAERLVVPLLNAQETSGAVLRYLNRLSDLLFVLARRENVLAGVEEVEWAGRG